MRDHRNFVLNGSVAVVLLAGGIFGCSTPSPFSPTASQPILPEPPPYEPCVLDSIPDDSRWIDNDAEVRMRFLGNGVAEYWLDGYHGDSACCWRLHHLRHEKGRCIFQCESPMVEWHMSVKIHTDGQKYIMMEKDTSGRNLPLSYEFTPSTK